MGFKPILFARKSKILKSSYSGSHQIRGGINYLKCYYFAAKPSQIKHFGLGGWEIETMRYCFNVQSLVE